MLEIRFDRSRFPEAEAAFWWDRNQVCDGLMIVALMSHCSTVLIRHGWMKIGPKFITAMNTRSN